MDPLTTQSRAQLLAELTQRHRDLLHPGETFDLVSEETPRGVRALLSLSGGEDGARLDLEARVDFKLSGLASDDALGLALDALDLTLGEYLEAGRTERLSSAFETRDLQGRPVSLRGRVRRPSLEAEANRLLGEPDVDDWAD